MKKIYLLTYGELDADYESEVTVEGVFSSLSKIKDYYKNDPLADFDPNHNHIYEYDLDGNCRDKKEIEYKDFILSDVKPTGL